MAARNAKFGPLREPIRIVLFIADQFSHTIKTLMLLKINENLIFVPYLPHTDGLQDTYLVSSGMGTVT